MTRLWMAGLHLAELFVSSLVHLLYGLYIFSTAVAGDLSQALNESLFKSNVNVGVKEEEPKGSTSAADLPPIVLVHGIFGFGKGRLGGLSYFAGAEKKDERVFVPDLGSLTSMYDRACELFYYLKGGQVDYGEEHSKACGHSRFGRIYEQGHYPEWDEDHPIHFVGHSAGAQVVRVLQQMLADKAFSGHENTSENWVLSVTSLSGAFNGTTRTYLDGMQPEDGRSLKPISLLQLCRLGLRVYDWLDVPWLKNYYNFGFDHFNMSWKKRGVRGFVDCLLGNSGPFASGDWILPDLTIQGSMRLNSHLQTFPNTYYFSYATKRTRKIMGVTVPSSIPGIHPLLFLRVLQMSQWRLPQDTKPPYKGYRDEDWWDNDGALNTISMTHPRLPVEHPSQLVVKDSDCQPMQPGIWGVIGGDDTNQDYVVGEEEAVWLVKMILPYLNEFLLKFRALFYGDPATTMKLAIMLFVLARFGSTITIWKMAKLGFFGVFSLPKICSSYSTLITAYGETRERERESYKEMEVGRRKRITWESRMKSDELNGGLKIFHGEEENSEESGDKSLRPKPSPIGVSGKRKTWKSENSDGLERSRIQIARQRSEINKNLDVQCKESSVSTDGIKKNPVQSKKSRSEQLSVSVNGIERSRFHKMKTRSEESKELNVFVERTERNPNQVRKAKSESQKEVGESDDGNERNLVQLSKVKSGSTKALDESIDTKAKLVSNKSLDGPNKNLDGLGDGTGGNSFELKVAKLILKFESIV